MKEMYEESRYCIDTVGEEVEYRFRQGEDIIDQALPKKRNIVILKDESQYNDSKEDKTYHKQDYFCCIFNLMRNCYHGFILP
jgi:hypothetical protein